MPDTVPVTIDVEPAAAAALGYPRARAAVGRLVSRALRPHAAPGELAQAIAEAKAEAHIAEAAEGDMTGESESPKPLRARRSRRSSAPSAAAGPSAA